jgi:hypothetical protein
MLKLRTPVVGAPTIERIRHPFATYRLSEVCCAVHFTRSLEERPLTFGSPTGDAVREMAGLIMKLSSSQSKHINEPLPEDNKEVAP